MAGTWGDTSTTWGDASVSWTGVPISYTPPTLRRIAATTSIPAGRRRRRVRWRAKGPRS